MPKNTKGGKGAKAQSNKKVQQRKDADEKAEREIYLPDDKDSTMKICQVTKIHNIREFSITDLSVGTEYFGKIMEKSNSRLVGKVKIGSVVVGETLDCMKGKLNVFHLYSDTQKIELEKLGKIPSSGNDTGDKNISDIFGSSIAEPIKEGDAEDDEDIYDFDDI
jgi:hypothetical protein